MDSRLTDEQRRTEALRQWRYDTALAEQVPTYIILPGALFGAILDADPVSLEELAAMEGMGPTRMERYGTAIMAVLDRVRQNTQREGRVG